MPQCHAMLMRMQHEFGDGGRGRGRGRDPDGKSVLKVCLPRSFNRAT